jgi:tetratricopeptide (TPR) repeat protein
MSSSGKFSACIATALPQARIPVATIFLACGLVLDCALLPQTIYAQSSDDKIVQYFHAGQQAMLRGEFSQAADEFNKVLALDPTLVEAEVNLGLAYHSLFDYEAAIRHLTVALNQRPNLLAPNVIVGTDYLKLGEPQKALPFLHRALNLDHSNREAREALASYYLQEQNFHGAAEQFKQLANSDPNKSDAWFTLGHQYLDLAARLAYRGARLYPDSSWGHRFLGDLLFDRSRWDESALEYRKALAVDPKQSGLHTALGQAYLHSEKIQEAAAEFHSELDGDTSAELAWLGLAEVALKLEQSADAIEAVAKAWEISPEILVLQREFPTVELTPSGVKAAVAEISASTENPAKHFLLSALHSISAENGEADQQSRALQNDLVSWRRSHAGTAVRCRSHEYSACVRLLQGQRVLTDSQRLLLGKAQFALRNYGSAADALGQVRGVSKANAEASYWLSRSYQGLGTDAYAQLEESFPDSWRTHQLKAEGYELHQDLDSAVKELQLALQMQPMSPELYEALGNLYIEKHADADAEKELEKALALDSARPRALYLMGRLNLLAGENQKAIPYLERALRLQPDLSEANNLLGTTYVRLGQFKNAIPPLEKAAQSDHYGNVHYQLYVAYRKLGQMQLAQNALARSQDLRRNSLEHDQALIMGSSEQDNDHQ